LSGTVSIDLRALDRRNERFHALDLTQHLITDHTRDQEVTLFLRMAKDVQVSDVKQIERTCGIADRHSHSELPQLST